MFLHVCVILFTGGVSGQTSPEPGRPPQQGEPPRPGRPPWDQADTPPDQADPPGLGRPPPGPGKPPPPPTRQTPPRDQADPLQTRQTPPPPRREEDCSIRSMSGRYASYWNAFLFQNAISLDISVKFPQYLKLFLLFKKTVISMSIHREYMNAHE